MSILSILIVCILIGWLAQSWKGRTGVSWFFISLIFMLGVAFFVFYSVETGNPGFTDKTTGKIAWMLVTNGIGGVIMLIVIATLPNKKKFIESEE